MPAHFANRLVSQSLAAHAEVQEGLVPGYIWCIFVVDPVELYFQQHF